MGVCEGFFGSSFCYWKFFGSFVVFEWFCWVFIIFIFIIIVIIIIIYVIIVFYYYSYYYHYDDYYYFFLFKAKVIVAQLKDSTNKVGVVFIFVVVKALFLLMMVL